jgi:putative ATPase
MVEEGSVPSLLFWGPPGCGKTTLAQLIATALVVATSCMQAVALIGMPEARIILAQCATYLATAKKSTASYDGISLALSDVQQLPWDPIPLHLRNPVNKVVKAEGYGQGHVRYPWKEEGEGRQVIQNYLPTNLKDKKYYQAP